MNLENSIRHFQSAFQDKIQSAAVAVSSGNTGALSRIVDSVKTSKFIQSIQARIESCSNARDAFRKKINALGATGKVFFGLSVVVAGALLWGSGSALAVCIGFFLIAYGISKALPAMWELLSIKLENMFSEMVA